MPKISTYEKRCRYCDESRSGAHTAVLTVTLFTTKYGPPRQKSDSTTFRICRACMNNPSVHGQLAAELLATVKLAARAFEVLK